MITENLAKAALVAAMPKIINTLIPKLEKAIDESIVYVGTLIDFSSSQSLLKIINGEPEKMPRKHQNISKEQYEFILLAWETNKRSPKNIRVTQLELAEQLNESLHLRYTRSGYLHLVNKRVIPKCIQNKD